MTAVRLQCPGCSAPLKTARKVRAGTRLRCPRCRECFRLEAARQTPVPSALEETIDGACPPAGPPKELPAGAPQEPQFPEAPGYVVLEELGRGGMGIVYKARHTALQRLVALKMIRSGSGATPSEVARFRAEATAVAQLQHPHIVQIYEVGEHAGLPYFSLELVDGPTLADRLAGTPQPARPAAELVEAVARALAAAHQRG